MPTTQSPTLLSPTTHSRLAPLVAKPSAYGQGFESRQQFAAVIDPHLPRLVSTAREILGSEDLAWDAVQETLMRVWLRGELPEEPVGVLIYLVRKSSLHLLRCQRRRHQHESSAQADAPTVCCEEDPLIAMENAERAQAVRDAVKMVAKDYRVVLELYEFQGKSYESIARQLSVPLGTVRSRLSRGRSMLRERLQSQHSA